MENSEKVVKVSRTERALDASNCGYRLLLQMGWRSGTGLGKHGQGIIEPVKIKENLVDLGLGKSEEYDNVTQLATSERRKLDAEVHESAEQIAIREAKGAKKDQVREGVKNMQAAFYCCDCRKQYKSVTEMENHLSSYDHHHTKRLKELQQQRKRRVDSEAEQSVKREKEREKDQLVLQQRIAAQKQAVKRRLADTQASNATVKTDKDKLRSATKVGFGFGGMKVGMKKPVKKVLVTCNGTPAFSNPFLAQ